MTSIREAGGNATGVRVDSTKLGELDALYAQIKEEQGKPDVLFANAGGGSMLPLGTITEAHYDDTFDRNVKGVLFTIPPLPSPDISCSGAWRSPFAKTPLPADQQ